MNYKDTLLRLFNEVIPCFEQEAYELSDYLADHPELSGQEYASSKMIVELLRKHGLEVEYPFAGLDTAFRAQINPEKKQRMALLTEYDALPDIGHACGHCASGSASILAGLSLHKIASDLDFGVDIVGTPDEEVHGGKCVMCDNGAFDGYDFAAMAHMSGENASLIHFIALDGMIIKFHGVEAHAAQAPHEGRNAMNAARLFFDAIDMMRQHIIPEARIHGYIRKCGTASNVVPGYAEVEFLTRAPKRKQLNNITRWVHDCAKAAALATRTECEIEVYGNPFNELYISPAGLDLMDECFTELGMSNSKYHVGMVGSSDIGNVDDICPAFHPLVSIGPHFNVHTKEFSAAIKYEPAHQAINNAAKLLLNITLKLYGEPERLEELKKQHKEYYGN